MEKAKKAYRNLTGSFPVNLVQLGKDTARKFAEVISHQYNGHFTSDAKLREMVFYTVLRTPIGYLVHDVAIHKLAGNRYAGREVDLATLPDEIKPNVRNLRIGQRATFYHEAKIATEIATVMKKDLRPRQQPGVRKELAHILQREHITEDFLRQRPYQYFGNPEQGYIACLPITNKQGIHFSPLGLISQVAKKTDSDISFKKDGRTARLTSPLGVIGLEAHCGDSLIIEVTGVKAETCIKEVSDLFQGKFDED